MPKLRPKPTPTPVVCNLLSCLLSVIMLIACFAQAKKQQVDNNPTLNMFHNEDTMAEDYATKRKTWRTEIKWLKNTNTELEQEIDQTEKLLDNANTSISRLQAKLAAAQSVPQLEPVPAAAPNPTVAQLEADLDAANSTIAQLQSELAAAKMATPQLVPVSDPAIAKLEADLAAAQFEITAKQQTITKMNNEHSKEVQELTKLLCAKKHTLINWYWNSSPKLAEFVCKKPKSDQCNIQTLLFQKASRRD